jgi:uncharacterized damage-inducible protein DinB
VAGAGLGLVDRPSSRAGVTAHLTRDFAWNDWANRETLASLMRAGEPPHRAVSLLAHLVGTEHLWYARIRGQKSPMAVWPELPLAGFSVEIARLAEIWRDCLGGPEAAPLDQPVDYVNSKGESYTSSVEDILTHVVFHGAYHRGQIAAKLREAGFEPAYTDYIHSVRQGFVAASRPGGR